MKFFKHLCASLTLLLSALSLSALSLVSTNVYADCLDGNNIYCINEIQAREDTVQYTIANNSQQQIYAFGVTNSREGDAFSNEKFWGGFQISQKAWDSEGGFGITFINVTGQDGEGRDIPEFQFGWATGGIAGTVVGGYTQLGSFASLFGEEEEYVNFYYNEILSYAEVDSTNPLNPMGNLDKFYFREGTPMSNFAVFGASGNVLASNLEATAAVPEPETYALFLAGLGLLGFAKRRKQA